MDVLHLGRQSPAPYDIRDHDSDDAPQMTPRNRPLKVVSKPPGSGSDSTTAVGGTMTQSGGDLGLTQCLAGARVPEHGPFRSLKQNYRLSDLLGEGGRGQVEAWNNGFVPSLLAWAGAHTDPFRVNSELYHVVVPIWERVFPDVSLFDDDNTLVTLVKVVGCGFTFRKSSDCSVV
jgi:hypothetical protein